MDREPIAARPYMPGYGIAGANQGRGLLDWAWAEERLICSHDYWLATVWPDGRAHVMPVWGVWFDMSLWFSSSVQSRKARNLAYAPRAAATTDDPFQPVVVEGPVEVVTDLATIGAYLHVSNAKYDVDYDLDFLDPEVNSTFRLRPWWAFGLLEEDFTGTPTRWRFGHRP